MPIIFRNASDPDGQTLYDLPSDRGTTWQPGVTYNGGITNRTTIFTTITSTGDTTDRRAAIQTQINNCPAGQVVKLGAGTFYLQDNLDLKGGITLRGSGPGTTILTKTGGASSSGQGASPTAAVIMTEAPNVDLDGTTNTPPGSSTFAQVKTLTADGVKGAFTVSVNNTTGLSAGDLVRIDELSGAAWVNDPYWGTSANIWAASDFLVAYPKHDPQRDFVDDFDTPGNFPGDVDHWYTAYTCPDRPICEMKEIASVNAGANTVTFTTPLHIRYRTANSARVAKYTGTVCNGAGVEDITFKNFDLGTVAFLLAKNCWILNCEVDGWFDKPINFQAAFRCEARRVYQHGTQYVSNSAENYAFIFNWASADCLVEDCISIECDKVVAARAAGAGCVFGYNYLDRGYIEAASQDNWVEVGANASHLVGPHHVLFEGNWSWNADSDFTHGNSCYITHFRNWYTGFRTRYISVNGFYYDDWLGNQASAPPSGQSTNGPKRCAAGGQFSLWHSYVGNVLGTSGQMSGWAYESLGDLDGWDNKVWLLGWDPPGNPDWHTGDTNDPLICDTSHAGAIIRDGNYDYVTSQVHWHGRGGKGSGNGLTAPAASTLRSSLYLSSKPSFFGSNTWPWVNAQGGTKTFTLPAKARYDAGTPFA